MGQVLTGAPFGGFKPKRFHSPLDIGQLVREVGGHTRAGRLQSTTRAHPHRPPLQPSPHGDPVLETMLGRRERKDQSVPLRTMLESKTEQNKKAVSLLRRLALSKFILPCLCNKRIPVPPSLGTALGCGVQKTSMKEPREEARLVFFFSWGEGACPGTPLAFPSLGKHLLPRDCSRTARGIPTPLQASGKRHQEEL